MAGEDMVIMKQKELRRLYLIKKAAAKEIKQGEAAEQLGVSERQVRRIVKRVREEGDRGVIHRGRGEESNRRLPKGLKERVIGVYREKYPDFGPTFAQEKFLEIEKIRIGVQTLRNWLLEAGLWQVKQKRRKYRRWRERKGYCGEMVQMDGSHHDWFEGRGPRCVLMGYIDDATSRRMAQFYEYEGTIPALASLKRYIRRYGIPQSLYLDKHSTYKVTAKPTIEDELKNRVLLSQVGRAAEELGVRIIYAHSAQAKGRVERSFKTYQDRLVKEMRLRGISTVEAANEFLKEFLPKHNRRFSIKAAKEGDLHRPVPGGMDVDGILCIKTEHPVRNDYTIAHSKKLYQIREKTIAKRVTVEERLNGRMYITYKGQKLAYKELAVRPVKKTYKPQPKIRKVYRPPLEHPWKAPTYQHRVAVERERELTGSVV